MPLCFFATDLHGHVDRYESLLRLVASERPAALFLGGDLLPSGAAFARLRRDVPRDFVDDFLAVRFAALRAKLGDAYPRVFVILGNDDARSEEAAVLAGAERGLWEWMHERSAELGAHRVYGYAYVPPTPFRLKDWERYDVSRYLDPGCLAPEEGWHTVPMVEREIRYATIEQELGDMVGEATLADAIMLFHCPPYKTVLDRAALDGKSVDYVPLDVHVGSIAVARLIERRQPRITLHGHVHESARLTGAWRDRIGDTHCLGAAHDGPELALVRFDPADPASATRALLDPL